MNYMISEIGIAFTSYFILNFFISGLFKYAFLTVFFKKKQYLKAFVLLYYSDYLLCIWILEILCIITDKNRITINNIYKNLHLFDIEHIQMLPIVAHSKGLSIKLKKTYFKYAAITYIILSVLNLIRNSNNIVGSIILFLYYRNHISLKKVKINNGRSI